MASPEVDLVVDNNPDPAHVRLLEDQVYEFGMHATGIADGEYLALFLRGADGKVAGGAYGWTWGGTCYIRYLFVPEKMRNQGHGTRIMGLVEREAARRRCEQIVLETHDFQAPDFYRKLGFAVVSAIDNYPRGHRYLLMVKRLR